MHEMRVALSVLTFTTTFVPLLGAGCHWVGIRANPRVAEVSEDRGSSRRETSFRYDAAGHLSEVDNDDFTLELEWDGDRLTEFSRSHKNAIGGGLDVDAELTYEGGRLTEIVAERNDADFDDIITLGYDGAGRLTRVDRSLFGDAQREIEIFVYDDAGQLREIVLDVLGVDTLRTEVEHVGGRPDHVVMTSSSQRATMFYAYDGDALVEQRVSSRITDADGEDTVSEATISHELDDRGLIVEMHVEPGGGDVGAGPIDVDIEYDEGDAVGMDVTPMDALFGVPLFDLRGHGFASLDSRTQAARAAALRW